MSESIESTAQAFSSTTSTQAKPKKNKQKQGSKSGGKPSSDGSGNKGAKGGGNHSRPRGMDRDSPEVRLSRTLSWILRHGAASEGIPMRPDGFVKVEDILRNSRIQTFGLTSDQLKDIVRDNAKQRFSLMLELADGTIVGYAAVEGDGSAEGGVWWIKANQGHSISTIKVEMKPILVLEDIPSKLAVHGTTRNAWNIIQKEGLYKMKRNHIHLAQGVGGDNVISGMRKSSQILIFIDIQKALDAGIKFELSDNGVVLTEGDERGYLKPDYFSRVEDARTRQAVGGWEGSGPIDSEAVVTEPTV